MPQTNSFRVERFIYNGFSVESPGGEETYTAVFNNWTNDPGIANCICSDGKTRLIPSCCLIGDTSILPKQFYVNSPDMIGASSDSTPINS